ncbi:ATP-binding cassette domain-containing protein [Atopococcus tabaci]|uniref:ATP-binding cassette domain-containing protein n=1 Tax=Atopococcus tabaci TaxID=269774 RepID=UPI000420484A|nr:ATP-binding cassette domain-containing protein [Atopococcus tabaci]
MEDKMILRGMRENNLKNIDLTLPKEELIVFTGLSGSGKSSVVFDTIAAESQRQMEQNYSQYLRRHMDLHERPKADLMKNLTSVIVIKQQQVQGNQRSDVGSYMDLGPLIRLLYSRIGQPNIGEAIDFSSQSSFGQCPTCAGNKEVITPDLNKLVDFDKSLRDYAVQFKPLSPAGWQGRWMITGGIFDPDTPLKDWPQDKLDLFLYGHPEGKEVIMPFHTKNGPHRSKWDGLLPRFKRLYIDRDISNLREVDEEDVKAVSTTAPCPTCEGTGLNPKVLESKINGLNIVDMYRMEMTELVEELKKIDDPLGESLTQQAIPIVQQMIDMGLGYLNLSRPVGTLSGGEAQRLKIASHLGSNLNNFTYILDEPSAGLHPEEVAQLIDILKQLKAQYNSVLVVEHNLAIMQEADMIVEMGPDAGTGGGEVIYQGPLDAIADTPTANALHEPLTLKPEVRDWLNIYPIRQASRNNLKNVSIDVPKNVLITVAGVSGSGKSSLMVDEFTDRYPEAIVVNQKGIGISTRSTLATYMGIMDTIRTTFAKATGQPAGLFSFNSLGACPVCEGKGYLQPEVAFADPVTMVCEHCGGTRYSPEALSYTYQGKNIVEILELTVEDSMAYFSNERILRRVQALNDVGLGYLTLGQSTSSLSGGELQRLKLASELQHQGEIYLLDEPSRGLHPQDNRHLLNLFNRLVDQGNTVVMIEHNLEFLANSDWVIELGPEGGKNGGQVVFEGTPHDMQGADTVTAKWLQKAIEGNHVIE